MLLENIFNKMYIIQSAQFRVYSSSVSWADDIMGCGVSPEICARTSTCICIWRSDCVQMRPGGLGPDPASVKFSEKSFLCLHSSVATGR